MESFKPIESDLAVGQVHYSQNSKTPFKIVKLSKHGQDCSIRMVTYQALKPTWDSPAGTEFTVEESHYLRTFLEGPRFERVVFLDFDGVFTICGEGAFRFKGYDYVDPRATRLLSRALEELGAQVVVSSTWRIGEDRLRLHSYLQLAGVKGRLHDDYKTKSLTGYRGFEIREWLERHPEVQQYAIIDDESDFYPDQPLIQTDSTEGFGVRNYYQLLEAFGYEPRSLPGKPAGLPNVLHQDPNQTGTD